LSRGCPACWQPRFHASVTAPWRNRNLLGAGPGPAAIDGRDEPARRQTRNSRRRRPSTASVAAPRKPALVQQQGGRVSSLVCVLSRAEGATPAMRATAGQRRRRIARGAPGLWSTRAEMRWASRRIGVGRHAVDAIPRLQTHATRDAMIRCRAP
jgi:hypothetical protein